MGARRGRAAGRAPTAEAYGTVEPALNPIKISLPRVSERGTWNTHTHTHTYTRTHRDVIHRGCLWVSRVLYFILSHCLPRTQRTLTISQDSWVLSRYFVWRNLFRLPYAHHYRFGVIVFVFVSHHFEPLSLSLSLSFLQSKPYLRRGFCHLEINTLRFVTIDWH